MGRFERKIRKKLQQDVPPFDQWFEEHKDQLAKFDHSQESAEDQGEVRAKRRVPTHAWIVGAAVLLLTALALTLAFLLPREQTQPQIPLEPSIPDLTFGEEGVYATSLSSEELDGVIRIVPSLENCTILESQKILRNDDNSIVMIFLRGEQETSDDFYFIEARFSYNDNYIFPEKLYYEELEHSINISGTQISYAAKGTDDYGFTEYRILSESDSATIYWTVSSISGEIDEWLQMTFAE